MDRVVAENGAPVMLSLLRATRIFVALEPVDMRQNFNGLYARVQSVLQQDPLSGHFFVFTNRSRTRLRLLIWDGSGLWVCTKRLDVVGALRQIFMDSARTPLLSVETMEDVMRRLSHSSVSTCSCSRPSV